MAPKKINKVEYFGNKEIIIYASITILVGFFIGVAFAHYKNLRFALVNDQLEKLQHRYGEYNLAYSNVDSDLPIEMANTIANLESLQYYTKCHEKSEASVSFDKVRFKKMPKIMISQSKITMHYNRQEQAQPVNPVNGGGTPVAAAGTGTFTAPETPIKVNQIAGYYQSYDITLPENNDSTVCVLMFEVPEE